jgi:hypothetical protein
MQPVGWLNSGDDESVNERRRSIACGGDPTRNGGHESAFPRSEGTQGHGVVQTLTVVSLDYAADHLFAAVRAAAVSEAPLQTRLQTVWDESVQHVWEKPCLTTELLARFKALWDRVTDPSDGPRSTRLRQLTPSEALEAIDELIDLAVQTAVTASEAPHGVKLATLADLT